MDSSLGIFILNKGCVLIVLFMSQWTDILPDYRIATVITQRAGAYVPFLRQFHQAYWILHNRARVHDT